MEELDVERIYKEAYPVSHLAALRAVYDAGVDAGVLVGMALAQPPVVAPDAPTPPIPPAE